MCTSLCVHTCMDCDNVGLTTPTFACIYNYLFINIQNGATALLLSAQKGHVAVVQLLLHHFADVNICDEVCFLQQLAHLQIVSVHVCSSTSCRHMCMYISMSAMPSCTYIQY